ncbi:prephenate dehydrogenase/arogenate dehydrogenase family protein [archaeon]|jgi:prephenate dehydrogenase|nr:prephenate dehydrogenase/arogenate dehydrogenase family protein [archaeon]MBT4648197.1 prephenate dehydrogenase/arogenate dehydrogenase family protein [archaeon]MBT6822247.1 prephenate dehydrogenase/arogenate dehydrogenase family protein [archaeon]MBT7392621.1 prephenate dehydrogenase/arogenate dehydrogenase family protein [archaeon]
MKNKIGIIGGNGSMGKWFSNFFSNLGHDVIISDLGTKLSNKDVVEQSDVIIISLPMQIAPKIVKEISKFTKENQLIIDITALKEEIVEKLLKTKSEIVSIHPLYGPSLKSISGQTVVVCDVRTDKWNGWIEKILKKEGAKIKEATPKKHDKMMSVIQGLTHFSLISLGHALKELDIDIDESLQYTSPIYKIRLEMVGRILNQNPVVYSDIAINNKNSKDILSVMMKSMDELKKIINNKDSEGFIDYFNKASNHFGEFKKEAMIESDKMIKAVSEDE